MKKLFAVLVMMLLMLMAAGGRLAAIEDPSIGGSLGGGGTTDGSHPWGGDGESGDDGGPIDIAKPITPTFVTGFTLLDIYIVKYYSIDYAKSDMTTVSRTSQTTSTAGTTVRTNRSHIIKKRIVR